ncbi:MAG: hypothetical protein Q9220_005561 [cf. Caloplaca sp. 1 TL-2023]
MEATVGASGKHLNVCLPNLAARDICNGQGTLTHNCKVTGEAKSDAIGSPFQIIIHVYGPAPNQQLAYAQDTFAENWGNEDTYKDMTITSSKIPGQLAQSLQASIHPNSGYGGHFHFKYAGSLDKDVPLNGGPTYFDTEATFDCCVV